MPPPPFSYNILFHSFISPHFLLLIVYTMLYINVSVSDKRRIIIYAIIYLLVEKITKNNKKGLILFNFIN